MSDATEAPGPLTDEALVAEYDGAHAATCAGWQMRRRRPSDPDDSLAMGRAAHVAGVVAVRAAVERQYALPVDRHALAHVAREAERSLCAGEVLAILDGGGGA